MSRQDSPGSQTLWSANKKEGEAFGDRVKNLRTHSKRTQESLAAQLHVSPTSIQGWEGGDHWPDIENFVALTELFKVSMDYLLGRTPGATAQECKAFGARVKNLREERKRRSGSADGGPGEGTQEWVAKQLGVEPNNVQDWEDGKYWPEIDRLVALTELFKVSVDYLLSRTPGATAQECKAFGARVKNLREERKRRSGSADEESDKWTQEWVAEQLGVEPNNVQEWEDGKYWPEIDHLVALANLFEVSLDYLLGRTPSIYTVKGVTWSIRPLDPAPSDDQSERQRREERERAEEIWYRLLDGERCKTIAEQHGTDQADLRQLITDLVVTESIHIRSVERNQILAKEIERQFKSYFEGRSDPNPNLKVVVASIGHIDLERVRITLLGHVAMEYFRETVRRRDLKIGFAGGFATSRFVLSLPRGDWLSGTSAYPIVITPELEEGISSGAIAGVFAYRHYGHVAKVIQQVSKDPSRDELARLAPKVDFVFMGVGSKGSKAVFDQDKDGVAVGDILYIPVDKYGKPLIEESDSVVWSIGLEGLRRVATDGKVFIIASGREKAEVLCAAVLGGYANVLIIDDHLAKAILEAWRGLTNDA